MSDAATSMQRLLMLSARSSVSFHSVVEFSIINSATAVSEQHSSSRWNQRQRRRCWYSCCCYDCCYTSTRHQPPMSRGGQL